MPWKIKKISDADHIYLTVSRSEFKHISEFMIGKTKNHGSCADFTFVPGMNRYTPPHHLNLFLTKLNRKATNIFKECGHHIFGMDSIYFSGYTASIKKNLHAFVETVEELEEEPIDPVTKKELFDLFELSTQPVFSQGSQSNPSTTPEIPAAASASSIPEEIQNLADSNVPRLKF